METKQNKMISREKLTGEASLYGYSYKYMYIALLSYRCVGYVFFTFQTHNRVIENELHNLDSIVVSINLIRHEIKMAIHQHFSIHT